MNNEKLNADQLITFVSLCLIPFWPRSHEQGW